MGKEAVLLEEIKHRQHYVFQAYLKNWTENNQIWCCRNRQKCFQTNTINVAQERDFYRIKDLNLEEERLLMLFLQRQSKERIEIMRKEMEIYKKPLKWKTGVANLKSAIKSTVYSKKSMPEEIENLFLEAERFTEAAVNDMVEDLHCNDEGELAKMLSMLKDGNLDFYYKPYHNIENVLMDSKCAFLLYVCSQHYRTKADCNRFIRGLNNILDSDLCYGLGINKNHIRSEHVTHHFLWYVECLLADMLYAKNAHLTLLVNKSNVPFITTDQPVINVLADYQNITKEVEDVLLYYPISPEVAITINDNNLENVMELEEVVVEQYNKKLVESSYEYVFANSKEALERYL